MRASGAPEGETMTETVVEQAPVANTDRSAVKWSYVSGTSDTPLLGMTIGDLFDQTVARYTDHDALISRHQGIRYTYGQLREEVDRCARGLMALGIRKGDRVGIWSPNRAEWTITQFATAKIGAILVNINPAYRVTELEYALGQSGCRMLVSAPSFRDSDYRAMVAEVRAGLGALEDVVFLDSPDWDGLVEAGEGAGAEGRDRLRRRMAGLQFDDPINIQYTSGTTGFPKGATLSH